MIVLIDNYDSFTYNLADYCAQLNIECCVIKNDAAGIAEIAAWQPKAILISPGPGTPMEAGISVEAVAYFSGKIPLLGVCLGHQAIAAHFGAKIVPAPWPMHGKQVSITHDNKGIFTRINNPTQVVRYHSLMVDKATLPSVLQVSALSEDGVIMAIRHCCHATVGVQFHPEAILTTDGFSLLSHFFTYYVSKHRVS